MPVTARLRSNRIKSELILKGKLEEDCFIMRNYANRGDYVMAIIKAPKASIASFNLPEEALSEVQVTRQRLSSLPSPHDATDSGICLSA